jgi:peroxiredoxin
VELPRLQPLYEQYKDQGFEVVAVEAKRDTERAKKFIEEKGLTYMTLENGEDADEIVASIFKVRSFPSSFLIDRDGKVMYFHLGFEAGDEESLEDEIKTLL